MKHATLTERALLFALIAVCVISAVTILAGGG